MFIANKQSEAYVLKRILSRITLCMVAVVLLQSCKLLWSTDFFSNRQVYPLLYHLINLVLHISLFTFVLILLFINKLKIAKFLLIVSFCSFISAACILWQVNLHIQYYFLLAMFICAYLFNKDEELTLYLFLLIHISLFIYFQTYLPDITNNKNIFFLSQLRSTNDIVFTLSCLICAIYIRHIIAQNWRDIRYYQHIQSALLNKLFPAQLMPALVNFECGNKPAAKLPNWLFKENINTSSPSSNSASAAKKELNVSVNKTLGVIFLDICGFTALQMRENHSNKSCQNIFQMFANFDSVLTQLHAKRIKTNGDQYIVIIGFSESTIAINQLAKNILNACHLLQKSATYQVKIGAAMGEVRCGVFDPMYPSFDIWGETVIRAARLESLANPQEIVIDHHIYSNIQTKDNELRACKVNLKGLGEHQIYRTFTE